jgi:DNA-3-methyladenine glycosylase
VIYMYIAYGVHAMFNVVTDEPGVCGAVLIRSMEPVEGTDQMRSRSSNLREHLLASGPGRVCKAMGFGPTDDGRDLDSDVEIRIEFGRVPAIIGASTRIGITRNEHALLRYYDPESKSVSGPARLRGPNPEQVFHAD